jgi:hypothetical protein
MSSLREHTRGILHNAIGSGVFYLILAICSAIKPFLEKTWTQPFQWNLNGVLSIAAVVLFVVAIFCLVRALAASRRPILTEEDQGQLKERREKAEAEMVPSPVIIPEVKLRPQYSGREMVDVTPDYLMGLFDQHTSIQAQRLIEPYIGKWMKISGKLSDIMDNEYFSQVTFERDPQKRYGAVYMYFRQPDRRDRLSVIRRGTNLTVMGQIRNVANIELHLDKCELV